MRLWLDALAIVALVTFVVINPVARVRLGTICATCGCGARPSWTWIGTLAATPIWAEAKAIKYLRRPPPKRTRKQHVSPRPKKDTA
jgi:hypothetical protein